MNILFISESIWMAGVVYDLHMMAEGLSLAGHHVYAIDPGEQTENASSELGEDKVQQVCRAFPRGHVNLLNMRIPKPDPRLFLRNGKYEIPRRLGRYRWLYEKIDEFLKRTKIDVIVLYSAVRVGRQAALLAKKHKIPIIFRNVDMLHKLWPTPAERFVAKLMEKNVYPKMDRHLALTPKYAEYLIKLGAAKNQVELLLFPIDMDVFCPSVECSSIRREWKIQQDEKVILFMGTLYPFGGIADFVKTFPPVLRQVPEAKLLIVGDGPLRPIIEDISDSLKIRNKVIVTGYQPFGRMPEFINAATICLNAFPINKVTNDLFSAKIVQYLSCKKATVSSALPGITTLIPGESAGVVYADTMEDLAEKAVNVLRSPQKRQELESAGYNYVTQNHSHNKIISRLENFLEETVDAYA